jgi:formate dehydrogenase major subunit
LREYKVKYRRPYSKEWEDLDLDTAMDMIADKLIKTREETWQDEDEEGCHLHRTLGFAHLGGATLDNEENYLIKKFFKQSNGPIARFFLGCIRHSFLGRILYPHRPSEK